ncbi:MAG: DUF2889 domain-containing protein [Syntrophobacteraceae bacterium]|jgi:hypothetical protein
MSDLEESQAPERLLCERRKSVKVFLLSSGRQFRVVAEMEDEIHHMRLNMLVNHPSMRIKEIHCEMPGVPDAICRQAATFFDPLIGLCIRPRLMDELKASLQSGCTHLANLFHEACYNLTFSQAVRGREEITAMFPGITEEQLFSIFLWFRPELNNSCVRYADSSPFMEGVRNAKMPAEAEKFLAVARGKQRETDL